MIFHQKETPQIIVDNDTLLFIILKEVITIKASQLVRKDKINPIDELSRSLKIYFNTIQNYAKFCIMENFKYDSKYSVKNSSRDYLS